MELQKRNKLILENIELVDKLARNKKRFNLSTRISLGDLLSAGYLALVEAANNDKFDEKKGSFQKFASVRISGAMSNYIKSCYHWGKWMPPREKMLSIYELDESLLYYDEKVGNSFEELIHPLPESGKYVMRLHYIHDLTYKQIGEKVGLSESRIAQKIQYWKELIKESID